MTGDKHINTINIAACSTAPWQLRGKLVMQHPDNASGAGGDVAKYTVLPLECRDIKPIYLLISTSVPPCTGALILSCLLSIVSVARKPQVHAPGYFMLLRWLDTNDTRLSHFIV